MGANFVRAVILFVTAFALIVFPDGVSRFQVWMIKKLGIKYDVRKERAYYFHFAVVLIVIGILLVKYG